MELRFSLANDSTQSSTVLSSLVIPGRFSHRPRRSSSSSCSSSSALLVLVLFLISMTTTSCLALSSSLVVKTPLIRSAPLSKLCGNRPVYLKLDLLQPSGSFKDRGMARLCTALQHSQGVTHVISSSGGNAGLAVATVGRGLGLQVSVVVPVTTKPLVVQKLQQLGATVTVHGANWNEADLYTRDLVQNTPQAAYISPYDDPLLWEGHASVVTEIKEQLKEVKVEAPAALICSVGGGGLLCGMLQGLQQCDWQSGTTVVAAETTGTASFAAAHAAGQVVTLDHIASIATSLGARSVTPAALVRSADHVTAGGTVRSTVVTDAQAVDACLAFCRDHCMLVEPACGAALAVLYSEPHRTALMQHLDQTVEASSSSAPIVVQVCGGSAVTIDLLQQWRTEFGLDKS